MCDPEYLAFLDRCTYSNVCAESDRRIDSILSIRAPASEVDHCAADLERIYLGYDAVGIRFDPALVQALFKKRFRPVANLRITALQLNILLQFFERAAIGQFFFSRTTSRANVAFSAAEKQHPCRKLERKFPGCKHCIVRLAAEYLYTFINLERVTNIFSEWLAHIGDDGLLPYA